MNKDYIDPVSNNPHSISLMDILIVLLKHLKIIIITPVIVIIPTIVYLIFFAQPTFESTVKFTSSSNKGNQLSNVGGFAAQLGLNFGNNNSDNKWLYPEVVRSRRLAKSMLRRKFDTEKYGIQKSLSDILTDNNKSKLNTEELEITSINKFISMILFSENSNTGIYTLTMSSFEPKFVRDLTIALIEELELNQKKYIKTKTTETRKFIDERINEIEIELRAKEEELKDFRSRNRRIDNSPMLLLEQQRINREVSVLTGVFTTLRQQLETTKIEELKESQYVIVIDPPEIPLQRSRPKKTQTVFFSGIFGILLGILLSVIIEYFKVNKTKEKDKIKIAKNIRIMHFNSLFRRSK